MTSVDRSNEKMAGIPPRRRSRATAAMLVAAIALGAGGAGWGAAQVLHPQLDSSSTDAFTLITVKRGQVGQSLSLNVTARWKTVPSGTNRLSGTVTRVVHEAGEFRGQGGVLYEVNERPVVVGKGDVPAYRDIERGAKGEDVRQLQVMLDQLGLLATDPDGDFGVSTEMAVRTWHETLGLARDGRVQLGEIIFIPADLPARLALDRTLAYRDAQLSGGEAVLTQLPTEPVFTITVTSIQAAMISDGTDVAITSPSGATWSAQVAGRRAQEHGDGVVLELTGQNGRNVAGRQADEIRIDGEMLLPSRVEVVPRSNGLVVPVAALQTRGDGSTVVVLEDGTEQSVNVGTAAQGVAVVSGVADGVRVRVSSGAGS